MDGEAAAPATLAIGERAFDAARQGRLDEALVLFGGLVERFGAPLSPGVRSELDRAVAAVGSMDVETVIADCVAVADGGQQRDPVEEAPAALVVERVAWALHEMGAVLRLLDRPDAALEAFDDLVGRFGDTSDPRVLVQVARALYGKAQCLRRLGRGEAAVDGYEAFIGRFGDSTDPEIRGLVEWAFYNKALAFAAMDRGGEAIAAVDVFMARFGSSSEPKLRSISGWALWKKIQVLRAAGRQADAFPVYEELIARHDEEVDPALSSKIAWCMNEVAGDLRESGRGDDAISLYDDVVGRFGESTDDAVREDVDFALAMKAYTFGQAERSEDELAAYDAIIERHAHVSDSTPGNDQLFDAFDRKATTLERLGRVDDALAVYDDALARLDGLQEGEPLARTIQMLFEKGWLLDRSKRPAEAGIVFDSAAAVYLDGRDALSANAQTLTLVVLSLLRKVVGVCAADPGKSGAVVRQLTDVLDDVRPVAVLSKPPPELLPEEEIAGLFAELHNGDVWLQFATCGDDETTRRTMAERALELYGKTQTWLASATGSLDTPAGAAASVIRGIADGYALLSKSWGSTSRNSLSLPSQLLGEAGLREVGLDTWAAAMGHPLEFSAPEDLAEDFVQDQREMTEQLDAPDLAGIFVGYMRQYEMLEILCDSPSGRAALQNDALMSYSVARINETRELVAWIWQQLDDAIGLAAALLYIAEALFVATHTDIGSSGELFPTREFLRSLLQESEAYDWLDGEDVELPEWLAHTSD